MVEFFVKSNIFIKQVAMSKFHSVFLSTRGHVYTCGIGLDGRLGHGDESTLVVPKLVDTLKDIKIIQVTASRNNSYFLSHDGLVYSCGSNEFRQLGHQSTPTPACLTPKRVTLPKKLKTKQVNSFFYNLNFVLTHLKSFI